MAGAGQWSPSSGNIINRNLSKPFIPRASVKRNDQLPMVVKKSKPRLITISTSEGKWNESWNTDYTFSLQQLQLHELLDDVHKDTQVSISLCVQKHAGLGLSVEGMIKTCFNRKCCNCCSPYFREEACSDACEKAEPKLHYLGEKNMASIEMRWHKLLKLKK